MIATIRLTVVRALIISIVCLLWFFAFLTFFSLFNTAICGNNKIDTGETCSNCPQDVGECCGNGVCEPQNGENCVECKTDCFSATGCNLCGDGVCSPNAPGYPETPCSCKEDCLGVTGDCCGDGSCTGYAYVVS